MSALILAHVLTGLAGIISGWVVVVGTFYRKRLDRWNAVFLATTAAACATGFVFLPSGGVTSAQVVAFYLTALLAVAGYARYVRRLDGSWCQVYAFTAVGALFLDVLIAAAQSFRHVRALNALAPTQHSPVYVVVKFSLLVLFVAVGFAAAKRASPS